MRYIPAPRARRRGVVLLVVITLLALFASVALSFVFYADAESAAAQIARSAYSNTQADADSELLLSYFLSQLIYDTDNRYSALRGHSLARLLYGWNKNGVNATPFNGIGRIHDTTTFTFADSYNMVSYVDYSNGGSPTNSNDNFQRTPGVYGKTGGPYIGGENPPWTSPDLNNMFLAVVNADGKVLLPSYFRPWTGVDFTKTDQKNDWYQKYLTLVPHPVYHTSLSLPDADAGGHVRNLDFSAGFIGQNGPANNDSYWLDLGFPVLTLPNGQKFKPLFAPLVMDLDNRLNLWVSGNQRGPNSTHVSNLGVGPTELNLSTIVTDSGDLAAIFSTLRFPNGIPDTTPRSLAPGPMYARVDYDALNPSAVNPGMGSSAALALPTAGSYAIYPDPQPGWDNVSSAELAKNPLSYNIFSPLSTTPQCALPFAPYNYEAVARYMGRGAPGLTSKLFQQLPDKSLAQLANNRARNMITPLSWSFDRVIASPYITSTQTGYQYNASSGYPAVVPDVSTTSPAYFNNWSSPPTASATSEFTSDYRSALGNKLRINLNRKLTEYPSFSATAGLIDTTVQANKDQYNSAVSDRTKLATDIYQALILLTGATDPNTATTPPAVDTTTTSFQAARWLAQLAVNIVDYVDDDSNMTAFKWYTDQTDATKSEWVFGTEMPRLVLNEIYAQYDTNPLNPGYKNNGKVTDDANNKPYNLNVWIELLNPHKDTSADTYAYPVEGGKARLRTDNADKSQNSAVYQVLLTKQNTNVRSVTNLTGDPDANATIATLNAWGDATATDTTKFVKPADAAFSGPAGQNLGFYVVGPLTADPNNAQTKYILDASNPGFQNTLGSQQLTTGFALNDARFNPTVILRRLAVPNLPYNNTNTDPLYNPYVTVDYVENVTAWDNRLNDDNGAVNPAPVMSTFASIGREQPFSAIPGKEIQQILANGNAPKNTLYQQNASKANPTDPDPTLDIPFDWLVHLDRPVINALELLHVSGYRPHELTQQFFVPDANNANVFLKFKHYAPWLQQESLIYRLLDVIGAPSELGGTSLGSRLPGKMNLNTLLEPESFNALCDPQSNGAFTSADVTRIFSSLKGSRGYDQTTPPTGEGNPFKPLNLGFIPSKDTQYLMGTGLTSSLLRDDGTGGTPSFGNRLLRTGANTAHPYFQMSLAQKIANNVTTTSNCFAVWLTVGFFEVTDDSVNPPKLGSELGRSEGKHIRHRFFAIVDRSELALFRSQTSSAITVDTTKPTSPITVTLKDNLGTLPSNTMAAGSLVEVGPDPTTGQSEVVSVTSVGGNQFSAVFANNYASGVPVIWRGNPGPQVRYNPRNDRLVVPHFTVIE